MTFLCGLVTRGASRDHWYASVSTATAGNSCSIELAMRLTALSMVLGECQGSGCSAPLATLLPLADAIVEGELGAMDAEAVRLGENIPTGLECYHGSRVNTWCCGQYDCVDRERPGAAALV